LRRFAAETENFIPTANVEVWFSRTLSTPNFVSSPRAHKNQIPEEKSSWGVESPGCC
jgi:hypothetical protein